MSMKLATFGAVFALFAAEARALPIEIGAGAFTSGPQVTFDNLAQNTIITNQYAAQGVLFGPGWGTLHECSWHTVCSFSEMLAYSLESAATVSFSFTSAQSRIGFELGSNIPMTGIVRTFLGAVETGSFTYNQNHNFETANRIFRGFEDALGIDRIELTFSQGVHHINNLRFENAVVSVPEPASLSLLAAGLLALGAAVRRGSAAR